jgi:hypothetical protein
MKIKLLITLLSLGIFNYTFAVLNTPNQVAPSNAAINQNVNAILDWDPVTGATGYNYQYDTSPAFNSANFFNGNVSGSSQVTLANLQFGTTYYWKVRAIKSTAPIDSSLWSSTFSFTTIDALTNLAPANGATNQESNVILDWQAFSGITGYLYEYDTSPSFNSPNLFNGTIGATSQVNTANLLFNTTYYWRVRAYHAADTSAYGPVWSFTTIDALTNLAPANGATNQESNVILDWQAFSGITGYLYEYDTSPSFNSPNLFNGTIGATSQVNTANLLFNTTYYWRVRAYHAADTSAYGPVWSFTTIDGITNLAPANGATNQESNVILDWQAFSGITGYLYEYDTSPSFNSPNLFNGTIGATSQVNTANLLFNTTYYWRVRAYHAADTSAYGPVWSFTTIDGITNLAPANGATNQESNVILDWQAFSGITGYLYEYDTSPSFNSPNLFNGTIGATSQVTTANLLFNTTYYWRVRAYHAADTSAYGPVWSFTTVNLITHLTPANGSTSMSLTPTLDWAAFGGILGYQYRYSEDSTFATANYGILGATSQVNLAGLLYGTRYFWSVRAFHAADTSDWSLPWNFTTNYQMTIAPVLISPVNGATNVPLNGVQLEIGSIASASDYQYQISSNSNFSAYSYYGAAGLTQVIATLNPSTTYYWRARGHNSAGNSPWATPFTFTTVAGAPPTPINLGPLDASTNIDWLNATISWSAVPGATTYVLIFDDNAGFSSPVTINGSNNFYDTGLLDPNTTYYWQVQAVNGSGNSSFSPVWSFTTGPVPAPSPTSPLNGALGVSINGTTVSWNAVNGATSYYLEYATNAAFTGAMGLTVTSTSYSLPTLLSNQTYYWHVYANYNAFSSVYSTTFTFTTVAAPILLAPQLLSPTNMATNIPIVGTNLTWQAASGALSYDWEISTDMAFTTVVSGNTGLLNTLLSSLTNATTYYWHVRSVNITDSSSWSNTFSFTTESAFVLLPPQLISPSNLATGIPIVGTNLTWQAASGALSYDWEISTDMAFTTVVSGNTGLLNTLLSSLNNTTTYYWHVRSVNTTDSSSWSNTFSFTTESAFVLLPPQLISPTNLATSIPIVGTNLTWQAASGALSYDWEISTDMAFTTVVAGNTSATFALMSTLMSNTTYYWHVRSIDADTISDWSSTFSFTTDILSGLGQNVKNGNIGWYLSDDQLIINFPNEYIGAEYQIVNTSGQIITKSSLSSSSIQIDQAGWSKGVYLMQIASKNNMIHLKLIFP